ncbi:13182_t:CDS:2 [Funneliformis geosporum]|nr:13182_t:CDS:2 [Funneliformis geosporum]
MERMALKVLFKKTKFPPIHEFYGILSVKISQDDYYHAQKTQLQKMSMEYDRLDPSHYISLPSYS